MCKKAYLAVILLSGTILFTSCNKSEPIPELSLVPATSLIHIHVEPGINSSLTSFAGENVESFTLADSLLKKGSIGISLVGVDISTLEPQLLILTRYASEEYITALAARVLDLDPRQESNRIDLVSEQGYARASVSGRDGWTAVYIGPAPHITLGSWLDLDKNNSLSADTALASVIPENRQLTILFPGNLFGFVSLLPLERQIPWWTKYKTIAETIKPAALSLSLSWPEPDSEELLRAGLMLARRGGGVSVLDLSFSDTQVNTDSCFSLLLQLMEGGNSL